MEDKVFLKVTPMKGVLGFKKKGKLSPRFVELFEILEQIGPVAYRLALPLSLSTIHDVFHVLMLRSPSSSPFFFLFEEVLALPAIRLSTRSYCNPSLYCKAPSIHRLSVKHVNHSYRRMKSLSFFNSFLLSISATFVVLHAATRGGRSSFHSWSPSPLQASHAFTSHFLVQVVIVCHSSRDLSNTSRSYSSESLLFFQVACEPIFNQPKSSSLLFSQAIS
ncbi:pol protein [Cucumis melo var. makuwa]|uniref:Pol protein n=1 Tax=Cucumis melo var. makuwa TaxID=1194695 RepID=A0A5D3DTG7_CUCMM|nr:pol protein [Cucumis melo var. makuwa]